MDTIATIVYWARIGVVGIVTFFALVSGLRRIRAKAAKRDLAFGLVGLLAVIAVAVMEKGSPLGFAKLGAAVVAGAALGFFLAKVRAVPALLTAVCAVFAAVMLLFGEPGAQSVGVYALGLGFGAATGQGVRFLAGGKARQAPAAEPAPPVEPVEPVETTA